jgi:tRNA-dihydrouridine synthase
MKILASFLSSIAIISCATAPKGPEYAKTKVIERMGDKEETPGWATGEKIIWQEGADMVFVHTMTMSGDARAEACMKAASLDAKTEMLRYIKENITSAGQLNEADAATDPAYESLTAFLSKGSVSGALVKERYWEKVEMSENSGDRVLKVRCAAKVTVKKSELERQLREATNPKAKGNPEIREALLKAQKSFIEEVAKEEVSSTP